MDLHPQPGLVLYDALREKYGDQYVRHDSYHGSAGGVIDFPVLNRNDEVVSALSESKTLSGIPASAIDFVFIDPSFRDEARQWLAGEKLNLLTNAPVEGEEA